MFRRITLLTIGFTLLATTCYPQGSLGPGTYNKHPRQFVKHRKTTEANAKYHKRIHRVIDIRQKQNLPMQWPKNALHDIIYCAATDPDCPGGMITAYYSDSLDNGLSYTRAEALARGGDTIIVPIVTPSGGTDYQPVPVPFEPELIKRYRIMEDWIFDYNYSDFRPTIVGIAPLFNLTTSGIIIGEASLFWLKMEELRPVLALQEVFNPYNSAAQLSYDDWFEMRMFASYIVKESNVWDYDLKYYEKNEDNPFAALLDSEAIKNDLFVFEHDLWEY